MRQPRHSQNNELHCVNYHLTKLHVPNLHY